MQLKWLVILVFVGVQTLTAAIVAVATWTAVTSSVATNTTHMTRAVADTVRLRYERFIDPATDAVDLARFILQRHGSVSVSLDTFEQFMFDQLTSHPVVDALYVGRSTGEFLMVKRVLAPGVPTFLTKFIRVEEGVRTVEFHLRDRQFELIRQWRDDDDPFDPRTRPWYRVAREQAEGQPRRWTDPYIFFTSGSPGVSTANALVGTAEDGWGAVSVDIDTGSFSRFLSSLSLPGGGEAFIAGWNGDVVALPSEIGEVGSVLFADPDGSGHPALLPALLLTDPTALEATRDGEVFRDVEVGERSFIVHLIGFAEAGMPWTIVVAVPEDAVFGWVYRLRSEIIAFGVGASAIATLLLLAFWSRAIERPIAVISARLAAIGAGDPVSGPPVNGLKEMRKIDKAVIAAGEIIAERQAARLELIERLRDLVEAMEQAPVGIAILESDRRVSFANRVARSVLSISGAETETLDVDVLGMTEAEFAAKAARVHEGRTLRSEAVFFATERSVDYDVVLSPLGAGETAQILVLLEDISAAKGLEAGLIDAREAAEDSDRAKTLFLAQMSHEFRTPLNAIAGFSEMLTATEELRTDKGRDYVRHIRESADLLLTMIERILEYARYESEGVGATLRPTDVGQVLRDAAAAAAAAAEAAQVTLDLSVHGVIEPVAADPEMLTRAFEQLLANAIKFSPPGATVSVAAAPTSQGRVPRRVTVGIADRGSGIPMSDLPKVFEPFWKGDTHLRASAAGPGLGLAIARRIIAGFGGQIEVESAPGEGTRVVATLPVFSGPSSDRSSDT